MKPICSVLLFVFVSIFAAGACSAQTITAFAGIGDTGFSGDGGPATIAQFSDPRALAIDGAGGLYIMDTDNWRIRRVSADGVVTTAAGSGEVSSPVEGPASQTAFLALYDLAVNPGGILYIADSDGLQKIDPSGRLSFVVTGGSTPHVAISNTGAIFIGDTITVQRLESDGSTTPIAGTELGDSGDGGPATQAQFFVTALATDRLGNVYILDSESSRVRKFAPGGAISTLAGTGTADFGGDGGAASKASLYGPHGIAVDVAGNVYISDTGNKRIRKVAIDGTIDTVAGGTDSLEPGDGGPARLAFLNDPRNLAVSCSALYVNDDSRIRSIALTAPLIAQDGVAATVKAGAQFTISGCNLALATAKADPTFSLPSTLAGASVTINGIAVSLLSVSPTQILAQAPAGIAAGPVTLAVSVTGNGTATAGVAVN